MLAEDEDRDEEVDEEAGDQSGSEAAVAHMALAPNEQLS